jgi:ribulose-5-phosphate 4-epimerase/fuculose-1-phosphate aldolase
MPDETDTFNSALRIMDGLGLTEAFGHLSYRDTLDPAVIHITPAMGPGLADVSKCVAFDLSGRRLPGNDDLPPPLETPMHLAIYKARPDVGAICRTHSPYAVSAGAVTAYVPCLHGFSLMLGRSVPVHKDVDLIHDAEGARALAGTLGEGFACLIRGNGALAVAADIRRAVVYAIYLEEACRIFMQAGPEACRAAAARLTDQEFSLRTKWHANEAARAWSYYKAKYASHHSSES